MAIQNRYEFMYYLSCTNANPNGDPDMGNMPRIDPETMKGYITDVATKRRIRNYVQLAHGEEPGMNLIIQQSTNINRHIAEAKRAAGMEGAKDKNSVYAGRKKACELFYDVRTFGAVMSTGPNAGQVRGPVQITFGTSLDPIQPIDLSITRMATAENIKDGTVEDYQKAEQETPEDKLRTMGRKQVIPFGLYEIRGFISANLAAETGFDDNDLNILFEAILNMYEHDRSASKGEMEVVSPLILFKHVGTDTDAAQRVRQAKLGCAPAHKLFELVHVQKKPEVKYPRSYRDYLASIRLDNVPRGVEVGFKEDAFSPVVWNELPADESWFTRG
ncbi:type I-C CRISPR-associated protein Cas7/Csd2 [bacterium]|uniref:type I-C CRISPR-associated protein Cas7/Csd2 n=1 Tax=Gemmiger sp. TaxID=2049027 RepID=UPI002A7F06E1|nr:type I-C CRISPR-associated protein Cas7/Csd2 [Gemmiger sp.]MCI5556387.1 type I-C CRISPR-associated protein Cas7/Csd2 [bacterium]MDD7662301.1 type I-C CRISPR-associated protein Cas7/Csd2 [Eubacteriales bacterium]MCI6082681.1 type I-C CRISPR-associated protein Cas7/Csd2 [bacterium]MCI6248133.1 type I-C CRISPR-associated protein Cas7/Csd2 [bacterium]MDY4880660.1 type I-C CRISPR-associated protein Cas7/Csd2 [Gemmiger sp.]